MNSKRTPSKVSVEAESGAGILNRTGTSFAPEMALELIREAQRTPPSSKGDSRLLAEYRTPYLKEKVPTGSRPISTSPGSGPAGRLLLDKLGERLAFERQGVRLYENLIGKVKVLGTSPGGPALEDLEHILKEELAHFRFLREAILESGGDPTVQSPCADIAGVLSQGIVQVISDPRTTVVQCLEAILNAELADNDGWTLLRSLAQATGSGELIGRIEEAEEHEQEHLAMVRTWLTDMVVGEASGTTRAARPASRAAAPSWTATKAKAGASKRKAVRPAPPKAGRR